MEKNEKVIKEALSFLKENTTAVLATTFNAEPHASTIYYVVDDTFSFYFITKRNTEKYHNMLLSPRAALVVGTGPEYITVQARGVVEPVKDEHIGEVLERFRKLNTSMPPKDWPINVAEALKDKSPAIFKIIPDELTFMNLDNSKYPESLGTLHHKVIGN